MVRGSAELTPHPRAGSIHSARPCSGGQLAAHRLRQNKAAAWRAGRGRPLGSDMEARLASKLQLLKCSIICLHRMLPRSSLPSTYCIWKVNQRSRDTQDSHSVPGDTSENTHCQIVTSHVEARGNEATSCRCTSSAASPSAEAQPCCPSGHTGPVFIPSRPAPFPCGHSQFPKNSHISCAVLSCSVMSDSVTP